MGVLADADRRATRAHLQNIGQIRRHREASSSSPAIVAPSVQTREPFDPFEEAADPLVAIVRIPARDWRATRQ
jgi:hypothetical protein